MPGSKLSQAECITVAGQEASVVRHLRGSEQHLELQQVSTCQQPSEVVEVDSIGGDFGAVIGAIADGLKACCS